MKISTDKIKHLMGTNLLTQAELATRASISRATVNGALLKGSCSNETAQKMAIALNVTVEDIMKEV